MLNRKKLDQLIKKIADEIYGDWLVFGGTVPYLVGLDSRGTIDVDLAPMQISTNEDALKLMQISESLDLPVETLNQAGSFFLNKIPNWQKKVILHKVGKLGRIFRPSLELYIELKTNRFSESDLNDCMVYATYCFDEKEYQNKKELLKIVNSQIKANNNVDKKQRLESLKTHIERLKSK